MSTHAHAITLIPTEAIARGPTNRKHFDQTKFDELVQNVRLNGILQAVLVRPHPAKAGRYELVFGERRWRAATMLKLGEMPCTVRELTDAEVLELQIAENKEREHLHELDEAELYERLMQQHGHTAADIAAKVGKDQSYVNKRMVLLKLIPKAKEAFYAGQITLSMALLLARLPDEKAQAEGLKYSQQKDYDGDLPTAFALAHFLRKEFMLALKGAPFDIYDPELTTAGACSACPKRTTNQTDLFGEDMRGDDRCLDGACFKKKVATWEGIEIAKAKQAGQTVLKGLEAEGVGGYSSKFVKLEEKCYEDPKHRTWQQLLAGAIKNGQVKATLAQTRHGLIAAVLRSEALKHSGLAVAEKLSKADEESKKQAKAARVDTERKEFIRSAKVDAVLAQLSAASENGEIGELEWRILADCAARLGGLFGCDELVKRRQLKTKGERSTETLDRIINGPDLDHAALVGLVFELVALRHDDPLHDLAKRYGVELKDVERQARGEFAVSKDPAPKISAGARPEAPQPARVGKQAKAVTANAEGKHAPVAKGRAPVFDGDEVTPGFFTNGVREGKPAPGVLPKADKPFMETLTIPLPKGYSAALYIAEREEGWTCGVDVRTPSAGVGQPMVAAGMTRTDAVVFGTAFVIERLSADMKTPDAMLASVRAWANKHGATKAMLKKAGV